MVSNYKVGDSELLIEIANRSDDYDYIHSIVFWVYQIYSANPTQESREPLETIHNKMNCGIHRVDVIQILPENKVLSEKIFHELQFDSYEGVSEIFTGN